MTEFRYRTSLRIGGEEWTTHRVELWQRDTKLGHITMAFIPRSVFDEQLSTIEKFACQIAGFTSPTKYQLELLEERYRRFEEFHVQTAHVAYIQVEEGYRRRGIATQLYLEGARWLAQRKGLRLAMGGPQQPAVKALWAKLVKDPQVPTVRLPDDRWALDF